MIERTRRPVAVSTLRVGRTDVGAGTAVLDDDLLTIAIGGAGAPGASGAERTLRVRLAQIDAASLAGDDLSLALHDGTRITLVSPGAGELLDQIVGRCRALPELTRTLRAFGSRRGQHGMRDGGADEQARFFAALMESRRSASEDGAPAQVIEAFDADTLGRALTATLHHFAVVRHGENGPARRALEAELVDLSEPLSLALQSLGAAAADALQSVDDLRRWRIWSMQLRATFETADRVWVALDAVLDSATSLP